MEADLRPLISRDRREFPRRRVEAPQKRPGRVGLAWMVLLALATGTRAEAAVADSIGLVAAVDAHAVSAASEPAERARVAALLWSPLGLFGPEPSHEVKAERLSRQLAASKKERVRGPHGEFIGQVGGATVSGLVDLDPDSSTSWSGPNEHLAWHEVQRLEVWSRDMRRPMRIGSLWLGAAGFVAGIVVGAASQSDELVGAGGFGMAGFVVGGVAGGLYGLIVPHWTIVSARP